MIKYKNPFPPSGAYQEARQDTESGQVDGNLLAA